MNCDCKYCDPWMMTADSFSAQNQIREFSPDSTTHSSGEPVMECDPYLPDTTLLCCSNVVQVPLSLNPFQLNLEFGTTHQVQMCYTSKQV